MKGIYDFLHFFQSDLAFYYIADSVCHKNRTAVRLHFTVLVFAYCAVYYKRSEEHTSELQSQR